MDSGLAHDGHATEGSCARQRHVCLDVMRVSMMMMATTMMMMMLVVVVVMLRYYVRLFC